MSLRSCRVRILLGNKYPWHSSFSPKCITWPLDLFDQLNIGGLIFYLLVNIFLECLSLHDKNIFIWFFHFVFLHNFLGIWNPIPWHWPLKNLYMRESFSWSRTYFKKLSTMIWIWNFWTGLFPSTLYCTTEEWLISFFFSCL